MLHYEFREIEPADRSFLLEMLRFAIGWRQRPAPGGPPTDVPVNRFVFADLGRPGDGGVLATRYGEPAGACWWRLLPAAAPGHGSAGTGVPELTIAVAPLHRRLGLGHELLTRALDHARAGGVAAMSLSVEPDNPALRLYERHGFEPTGEDGASLTMLKRLGGP